MDLQELWCQVADALLVSPDASPEVVIAKAELLRKQRDEALGKAHAIEHLLLDLTPGGSEFHGSPERCAEWIRDRLSSTGKLAGERNRLRIAADALAEEAEWTSKLMVQLSAVVYKEEIQDHLPYGLLDEVKAWVRRNKLEAVLRQYEEAKRGLDIMYL